MPSFYEITWLLRLLWRRLTGGPKKRKPLGDKLVVSGSLEVYGKQLPPENSVAEYTVATAAGKRITYRSFYQGDMSYGPYSDYCRAHGCAVCSLTTLAAAFDEARKDSRPELTIETLEKEVVGERSWYRNYHKKRPVFQSPITMYGIAKALALLGVKAEYVPVFRDAEARRDILEHLQQGNPVVIEVGRKNLYTGEVDRRWTYSYHTMILIGLTREGQVLVNDSNDRTWYTGPQRFKLAELEDIMAYMFSCRKEPGEYYYCGPDTDGGYIKIYA